MPSLLGVNTADPWVSASLLGYLAQGSGSLMDPERVDKGEVAAVNAAQGGPGTKFRIQSGHEDGTGKVPILSKPYTPQTPPYFLLPPAYVVHNAAITVESWTILLVRISLPALSELITRLRALCSANWHLRLVVSECTELSGGKPAVKWTRIVQTMPARAS